MLIVREAPPSINQFFVQNEKLHAHNNRLLDQMSPLGFKNFVTGDGVVRANIAGSLSPFIFIALYYSDF